MGQGFASVPSSGLFGASGIGVEGATLWGEKGGKHGKWGKWVKLGKWVKWGQWPRTLNPPNADTLHVLCAC